MMLVKGSRPVIEWIWRVRLSHQVPEGGPRLVQRLSLKQGDLRFTGCIFLLFRRRAENEPHELLDRITRVLPQREF